MSITAVKCESFAWMSYVNVVGFVLSRDGNKLPGMIAVDVDDLSHSIDGEIGRLQTDYATYNPTTKTTSYGPWFESIDKDEIESAIKAALI